MGKLTKLMGSTAPAPAPSFNTPGLKAALLALAEKTATARSTTSSIAQAGSDKAATLALREQSSAALGEAELLNDASAIAEHKTKLAEVERRLDALGRRADSAASAGRSVAIGVEEAQSVVLREFGLATRDAHKAALAKLRASAAEYLAARALVRALRLEPPEPLAMGLSDPETGATFEPAFSPDDEALLRIAAEVSRAIASANSAANAAAVGPGFGMGFAPARRVG